MSDATTQLKGNTMSSDRKNITQPADWWAEFEFQAKREGLTLSEWVGECCKANIAQTAALRLSKRTNVGAPKRAKGEGN